MQFEVKNVLSKTESAMTKVQKLSDKLAVNKAKKDDYKRRYKELN